MKTLKNFFAAFALTAVLTFGATGANAGIIVAGIAEDSEPCTETSYSKDGIIVAGITGIIVAGFTGIIVAGAQEETTDCGIIVAG